MNKSKQYKRNEWLIIFVLLLLIANGIQIVDAGDIVNATNLNQTIVSNWTANNNFENPQRGGNGCAAGVACDDWEILVSAPVVSVDIVNTEEAYDGTRSAKITTDAAGVVTLRESFLTAGSHTAWNISKNSTYKLSMRYKGTVSVAGGLRFYAHDGTTLMTSNIPVGVYNTWQTATWTIPLTINPPNVLQAGIQSVQNANTVWVDDLNLTVNQQELPFIDNGVTYIYKINITDNYINNVKHPMYVALYHAGLHRYGAYYTPTFGTYVTVNPNDHANAATDSDTFWWGSGSNNATENMIINLTKAIETNNSASINSSQVYGYGTSMGGRILAIALKSGLFKGVQLNSPLINHSVGAWYTNNAAQMNSVFGGAPPNSNFTNADADALIQYLGYTPSIPVRVIWGENDIVVDPINNSQKVRNQWYSVNKYFEATSIHNGVHNTWVAVNLSEGHPIGYTGYIQQFFDLLRTHNNDLSRIPYIEINNATADVYRSNVTNSTTNLTFELLTTSAADLIVTPHNIVHNNKTFYSSQLSIKNQISPTNTTLYFNLSANTLTNISQVNLTADTTTDSINITILTWGNTVKKFTASSNTHINPTVYTIGDFPANSPIQVNKNGVFDAYYLSNGLGYITFAHSAYSDVTIEAFLAPSAIEATTCPGVNSDINAAFGLIGVLLIVFASGMLISGIRSMNYPFMIIGIGAAITGAVMIIVGYFITVTISNGVGCLG